MIHLNRETPVGYLDPFIPELYIATNIQDFLDNRGDIIPTRRLLPVGMFWNSWAGIFLYNPITFSLKDDNSGIISDFSASLDVLLGKRLNSLSIEEKQQLTGKRSYEVGLIYGPDNHRTYLSIFKLPYLPEHSKRRAPRLVENLGYT